MALDQATKALVRADARARRARSTWSPGVKLVNVRNRGIAFGLLAGGGALLVVFAAVALLALLVFFVTHTATARWCGCRPAC